MGINGEYISHHQYADDIIIVTELLEQLSKLLHSLNGSSRRVSIGVYIRRNWLHQDQLPLKGELFKNNVYLVQVIQLGRNNFELKVTLRIELGNLIESFL